MRLNHLISPSVHIRFEIYKLIVKYIFAYYYQEKFINESLVQFQFQFVRATIHTYR